MKMIQSMKRRISGSGPTTPAEKPAASAGRGAAPPTKPATVVAPPVVPAKIKGKEGNAWESLPALKDTAPHERQEVFKKKLEMCCIVYDFNNAESHQEEKEFKRLTLLELVDYATSQRNVFPEAVMPDVVNMVSVNIFRALPPSNPPAGPTFDPEEDEPTLEPAWQHLQVVYEFFLRFIVSSEVDAKIAKKQIDSAFILKLLELFHSEDPRERDFLKTVLHRIYGKFMAMRSFIRKSIQNVFFKFIYEHENHSGVAELLEILGSIINGFALPLKDEHRSFLERALVPLHKAKLFSNFHQQLSYCMTQYVEKDPRLAESVILGLLKYWPVTNSPKEVLFLHEIEELLELTQLAEFQRIQVPLFKQVARCINSPHFQVAERALFLWNNDYIVNLIAQHKQALFPVVIGALYKNSKHHWNSTVHGLTYNVLKLMMEMDSQLFDQCSAMHRAEEEKQKQMAEERTKKWCALETAAAH
eukprot:GILK01002034.1.p1 GENE.GILK01002034.1~~GILK01002034.1.p1  ORF type:complete len:473 (+),score=92.26 GILK01002034.1:178-1596(+)